MNRLHEEMKALIRRDEAQEAYIRIREEERQTLNDFEKSSISFQWNKRRVAWAAARTARAEAALQEFDA